MLKSVALLKRARQIHLYFGVFIAPAVLFFAITGALQTFSLHETTRGSDYKPPTWLVKLSQLHKKQTVVLPTRRPPVATVSKPADPPATRPMAPPPPELAVKQKNLLPMKVFFLVVSIGLVVSTFTGIFMAYRYAGDKRIITGLLVAGILVPVLLLPF